MYKVDQLIEKLEKLTGKKVKLKEASPSTRTMGSLTQKEFEILINNDKLFFVDKKIPMNLTDVISKSLEENNSLEDVANILGLDEEDVDDLDHTNYEDAAMELTSSYKRFKEAIAQGYISAKEPLNFINSKKVKLKEVAKTFKKDIGLSISFDEFREIDSLLRKAGFKASTIEDTVRGIVDETLDYYWWIARGDDMPHGITINNPKIFKTKTYNTLLNYQSESESEY